MPVNGRNKGASAEREVKNLLNNIVDAVRLELGLPWLEENERPIQRNQMQSAVSGHDLIGCFGLAIEIKRQETLSLNAWWDQTVTQAQRVGGCPVLLYRQNHKPWKAVMWGCIGGSPLPHLWVRSEFSWEDFEVWFTDVVRAAYTE